MRTGCQWRQLPSDFPPSQTVCGWFARWRDDGTPERINHALVMRDRNGAPLLFSTLFGLFPWLQKIFADAGYAGEKAAKAIAAFGSWVVEIVHSPADAQGFQVLPRRWVVERTFAWLCRNRRLAKDFETLTTSANAYLYAASIMLLTRRLARTR